MRAGFVHKYQTRRGDVCDRCEEGVAPGRNAFGVAFLGNEGLFLRNSRCGCGDELEAEILGAPMKVVKHALPVAFFVAGNDRVRVAHAESHGVVEENG
jgi:hypothetical protein